MAARLVAHERCIRTVHETENDMRRAVHATRSHCQCREQDEEQTVDGHHGRG